MAVHDDMLAFSDFNQIGFLQFHCAVNHSLNAGLFCPTLGGTANMESPHGQLGSWLTDGLGGNDANRFTNINRSPSR
jgi:hypothetical protein